MKISAIIATILSLCAISFLVYGDPVNFTLHAQSDLQVIKSRDLVIDLDNGLKTNAKLTYPAVAENGKYPGILLIAGSGPEDMNTTAGPIRIDNKTGQKIYPPTPFFQIAQYLSERGFAVLRYDKRGTGANSTILDSNVWGNATFNDLKEDAEKALAVLAQQPEVDSNRITIIGHSEGTIITPRVALDSSGKVKNIVLMGAAAQNLRDILYLQVVGIPIRYAQEVLDHNHNGLLSVSEAAKNPVFSTMSGALVLNLDIANGTGQQQLNPNYNTNKDTYISIDNELKPKLVALFESLSVFKPGERCTASLACPIWLKSHYALEPTLSMIGNVPPTTSILILQGENDTQTPIQGALLMQQKLTEINHPDHILITYPNLGHVLYPSSQWVTSIGLIPHYVLADLYSWLESHSGLTRTPSVMPSSYSSSSSTTNSTTK